MVQRVYSRVVEIVGPLHLALHILQSIFIIYKDMMIWSPEGGAMEVGEHN